MGATQATTLTPEAVEGMKAVTQQAAAWAVSMSARALRDRPDCPRNRDGTYCIRDVVEWHVGRRVVPRVEIPDDLYEVVLSAAEQIQGSLDSLTVITIMKAVSELESRYGDGGLLAFVDALVTDWREHYETFGTRPRMELTEEAAAARVKKKLEEDRMHEAYCAMRIKILCERCGLMRNGREWIPAEIPPDFTSLKGACPACEPELYPESAARRKERARRQAQN